MITRDSCLARDRDDPLRGLRELFDIAPSLIYLDGNSLGVLPRSVAARVAHTIEHEWGRGLIGSWNSADWINLPARVGAKIARLIGARDDEVIAADSTSVNLFKVLSAALALRPQRKVILSEAGNFPTDLYIAQGLIRQLGRGYELRLVDRANLEAAIDDTVAVAMLTQVDYRTGSLLDMAGITARLHQAGALALWDLAHSAGALPVELNAAQADFAVGCGYKYLNGGPGAPAFLFVAQHHQASFTQPLSGWMGHAAPFEFDPAYRPAEGIGRYLCGTPPVLGLVALEAGVDTVLAAEPLGGLDAIRRKSLALTDLFVELVSARCAGHGLNSITPAGAARGSQVSWALPNGSQAYAVVQALIARGVVGDFRSPDVMRFGFTPLYLGYADVWDAVEHLRAVLAAREWDRPEFLQRQAVT